MTSAIRPPLPAPQSLAARRVGIVGGGQLARMMAEAAPRLGLGITVLDPTPDCPAHEFATQIVGEFDDLARLADLAGAADVVTLDIEAVSARCLEALERSGTRVAPSAQVLAIIQDKLRQKEFLRTHALPTSDFREIAPHDRAAVERFGMPCVLKARRHGYDGRGVKVVRTPADADAMLAMPCLVERLVDIDKELAVMVARSARGEMAVYPVVEAVFDPRANILDLIRAPANIAPAQVARCEQLGREVVEALDGVGIFGIEFFLDRDGAILVNEISPRPHNSGHYTIEACATSQFEQHLRAVTGMPLGPTTLLHPAASFNLLGEPDAHGTPRVVGGEDAMRRGAAIHLYGKHTVKPFRKMGHVTITATTIEQALTHAAALRDTLKIKGTS
ncbi:MAG: 5-(carboxyamino)imidazole ribonucleotide synthase [Gammaproteobacteria bacterium]